MAYGPDELFVEGDVETLGKRCISRNTRPGTIAAVSGAPLLATLTPMAFNTATQKWNVWAYSTGEVNTITDTGTTTGGTYTITVNGETTTAIAYDAANATILAALNALGNVDAGDVVLSGGGAAGPNTAPLVLTWGGKFSNQDVAVSIDSSGVTGGGSFVMTTVAGAANGVDGSGGLAFIWPQPVQTSATDDTLANMTYNADIHIADIAIPDGQTLANLKTALRRYGRLNNFNFDGLTAANQTDTTP